MTDEEKQAVLEKHADDVDYICDNIDLGPELNARPAIEQAFLAGFERGVNQTLVEAFKASLKEPAQ